MRALLPTWFAPIVTAQRLHHGQEYAGRAHEERSCTRAPIVLGTTASNLHNGNKVLAPQWAVEKEAAMCPPKYQEPLSQNTHLKTQELSSSQDSKNLHRLCCCPHGLPQSSLPKGSITARNMRAGRRRSGAALVHQSFGAPLLRIYTMETRCSLCSGLLRKRQPCALTPQKSHCHRTRI